MRMRLESKRVFASVGDGEEGGGRLLLDIHLQRMMAQRFDPAEALMVVVVVVIPRDQQRQQLLLLLVIELVVPCLLL